MRAGGCTVQQSLTPEATSVVKQAVALARRRGHAQVTPLHVANTMLAASTGLLRTACLQSHNHPLQCRALELCFNVALNRLPTSTGSPMLGGHFSPPCPSISNALVAAFKRAQAHQRRGSIESQQQPILAVKIELEQLIISILDDPSVSRVMREAGFSSTQVKSNVEQAVSLEICSKTTATSKPKAGTNNSLPLSQNPQFQSRPNSKSSSTPIKNEDVMYVIDNLVDKRRNFVIVGECLASIDGVVRAVVEKVDKRDVPEALKDVKFITLSFSSFGQPSRVEVEQKVEELKTLVRSRVGKGVILNLGDLNWVVEYRARNSGEHHHQLGRSGYNYCAVEHMIMEIGKLACGLMGENGRFWLIGIATFQTYMRCKSGHPSLESIWCLNTLTIPAGSLRLSLIADSETAEDGVAVKKAENGPRWPSYEDRKLQSETALNCCADCSAKFESEVGSLKCSSSSNTASTLPAWLQQYKNETTHTDSFSINELRMKWNSICESIHRRSSPLSSGKPLPFSSLSPSSSFSRFSYDHQRHSDHDCSLIEPNRYPRALISETPNLVPSDQPDLRLFIPGHEKENENEPIKTTSFSSRPNSAASSGDIMDMEYVSKFKSPGDLTILSDALDKKVPWQKDITPEIARTILKCRSGLISRKQAKENEDSKQETWLIFEGVDAEAKEKIARELAEVVFGSQNSFISICLSSFSSLSTRAAADSTDLDLRNKRLRDEQSWSTYIERFSEAVACNPHRVFFVEDIEQCDYFSQMGFKRAIEKGRVRSSSGKEVTLGDAIVIMSCESFSSRSRACSPPVKQKSDGSDDQPADQEKNLTSPCMSLDLNLSLEDDISEEQSVEDDIGLLEAVDGRFHFRVHHQQDE